MSPYNPDIHHRRSIRLKGYDYAREGLYFITLCVQNREHIFGDIKKGNMILNPYGQMACEEWVNTSNIRDQVALHEFIVMPNHFHAIIEILFHKGKEGKTGTFRSPSQTIGSIIRGYKIATIKKIKDFIREDEAGRPGKIGSDIHIDTGELQFAPSGSAPNGSPPGGSARDKSHLSFDPAGIITDLDFKIWQRNYYEKIIRNERAYRNISEYIRHNPKKWEEDKLHKKEPRKGKSHRPQNR